MSFELGIRTFNIFFKVGEDGSIEIGGGFEMLFSAGIDEVKLPIYGRHPSTAMGIGLGVKQSSQETFGGGALFIQGFRSA